jgi:hypothetical protein
MEEVQGIFFELQVVLFKVPIRQLSKLIIKSRAIPPGGARQRVARVFVSKRSLARISFVYGLMPPEYEMSWCRPYQTCRKVCDI